MGHGTNDKMFMTPSEHSGVYGQHGAGVGANLANPSMSKVERLAYDRCSLSLQPWQNPVCSKADGTIFELTNVIPYIKKYGKDPVTGRDLGVSDLVKLNFHKNEKGNFFDPVSFKEFTEHTHLVAVRPSGNVFTHDTVQQLNVRAKNMRDLIDDTPFGKADIITLQDPLNVEGRSVASMHHVRNKLVVTAADKGEVGVEDEVNAAATGSAAKLIQRMRKEKEEAAGGRGASSSSQAEKKATVLVEKPKPSSAVQAPRPVSTGLLGASFTSTAFSPRTATEVQAGEEHDKAKKAMVRLEEKRSSKPAPTLDELVRREQRRKFAEKDRTTWFGTQLSEKGEGKGDDAALKGLMESSSGVGKYLSSSTTGGAKRKSAEAASSSTVGGSFDFGGVPGSGSSKKKKASGGFGDFSAW